MKNQINIAKTFLLTATIASASLHGAASAASACKGLDTAACNGNASCSWVAGYERKDGRKVSAFCRSKAASKKSANAAKPTKKQQQSG